MDEREDYADVPPDPGRWYELGRNLAVAGLLLGLAILFAGLGLAKVADARRIRLPEVPAPEETSESRHGAVSPDEN